VVRGSGAWASRPSSFPAHCIVFLDLDLDLDWTRLDLRPGTCSLINSSMDSYGSGGNAKENKPRRLEEGASDETFTYLRALDDQQLSKEGLEPADLEVLVDNVLSEIKSRAASAASDRRTNDIVEKLILASNLAQAVQFMNLFAPYAVFLARNRFSSHLLQVACKLASCLRLPVGNFVIRCGVCCLCFAQSLLSRVGLLLKTGDIGSTVVEEETISAATVGLLSPLLVPNAEDGAGAASNFDWLTKDMCASHVLRSALCLLAGLPCIAEKKVGPISTPQCGCRVLDLI
jgi:hypothetical protein